MPKTVSVATRQKQLLDRRKWLVSQIDTMEADLRSTPDQDWQERAVDIADDEVQETLSDTDANEIRAIDAALKRIEEGTYGNCVRCDEPIEEARLDLLPHTPFCARCANIVAA